ncbi:MAG: hypothetical protein WCO00_01665 [Rhodospirillaceae bacterium]
MTDPTAALLAELIAALKAAMPYALESARRHERLGLSEEAGAARAVHRQAQWALHAAGHDPAPRLAGIAGARECED